MGLNPYFKTASRVQDLTAECLLPHLEQARHAPAFRAGSRPPRQQSCLSIAAAHAGEIVQSRRQATSAFLLATALTALHGKEAAAQSGGVAGLGNVENATEGVNREEKVAISSITSTDTLEPKGKAQPLPEGEFKSLKDSTLAYTFSYPVTLGGDKLAVIVSRRPERYSSAAPLSPDARQRIVSELVDFSRGLVFTMTVGPPSGVLKEQQPMDWKPKDVAQTVLIDKSTARVTEGQRVALQQVEKVQQEERDGTNYWTYEHLSQGSPNMQNPNKETYRHSLAVTAWRAGLKGMPFLYTLNMSCPDDVWPQFEPLFQQAVSTFRLVDPGKGYIPPDKDPWRFF